MCRLLKKKMPSYWWLIIPSNTPLGITPAFFQAEGRIGRNWKRFLSSRRRHTSCLSDWSSDVCSSDLTVVNGGRRHRTRAAGWLGKPLHHRHLKLPNRGQRYARLTGVQTTFLSALRMVQLEASRSSSAEFRLFLLLVPVPSGMRKKAACLLQAVSETSPKGLLPFPVPEQSFPVAGGTLQTLATGFRSVFYCNATNLKKCPVFLMRRTNKNDR